MFSALSKRKIVILVALNLSSANAFNLVTFKNLSFCKGLIIGNDIIPVNNLVFSSLPTSTDDWFNHLCEENRQSKTVKNTSGLRSKTKGRLDRKPTVSHQLVPMFESMQFYR